MSLLSVCYGTLTVSVSIWSGESEAHAASRGEVTSVNDLSQGYGPVYEFSQASDSTSPQTSTTLLLRMDLESESPTLLASGWAGKLWMGFNGQVMSVSSRFEIDEIFDLGTSFAGFHLSYPSSALIAVSEAGLHAFSMTGQLTWSADLDLITGLEWSDSSVLVSQMDSDEVVIDLKTGTVLDMN